MSGRMLRFSPMLLLAALAGCGGTRTLTVTQTVTTTVTTAAPSNQTMKVRAYYLKDGRVAPVARHVPETKAVAGAAVFGLLGEPPVGYTSALPSDLTFGALVIHQGILGFRADRPLSHEAQAQIVYTLTQFPSVNAVEIGGKSYTRADFEDVTPLILVESPLPGETVTSQLHATGTSDTFEATFEYDLVDADGKVIAHHFVTATSGSGTRGTFDFTAPFHVDRAGAGKLVVYERSAANGARIHVSEIPLQLAP